MIIFWTEEEYEQELQQTRKETTREIICKVKEILKQTPTVVNYDGYSIDGVDYGYDKQSVDYAIDKLVKEYCIEVED